MIVLQILGVLLWILLLSSYVVFAVIAARDMNSDLED